MDDVDRPVVAAFDLDGTLTSRDCARPFVVRLAGRGRLSGGLARRAASIGPAVVRRDRDALKALVTEVAFAGRQREEIEGHAEQFGAHVVERWMRTDTIDRLRAHRERGDDVLVVSASYEPYVEVIGRHLGVDDVLATRLEYHDEVATGRLAGPNCRGVEKVSRLHEWLEQWHGARPTVEVWAYGDSAGDAAMLADADHGIHVRALARTREPLGDV